MSETEKEREKIIEETKKEAKKLANEILEELDNVDYFDNAGTNTICNGLPWTCDQLTRLVDRARQKLDQLNGNTTGMYPWA